MRNTRLRKLLYAAMLMALGLLLPFLTGQNFQLGQMLSLMHIPVLLCGFICGWPWGLAVGFITPLLRSLIFSAPPMMPTAIAMAFELAVYGLLTGLLYRALPKKNGFLYMTLIVSMVGGRVVWGAVSFFLYGFIDKAFTWQVFVSSVVLTSWPAILIQIALVPALLIALKRTKVLQGVMDDGNKTAAA